MTDAEAEPQGDPLDDPQRAAAALRNAAQQLNRAADIIDAQRARIERLEADHAEQEKARNDAPKSPPTHLATPMQVSAGFQSVAYSGRFLGEGPPPYVE